MISYHKIMLFLVIDLEVVKIYPFSDFQPNQDSPFDQRSTFPTKDITASIFSDDLAFGGMYPEHLRLMSLKQWTPLLVARKAGEFLAEPEARVLDVGSGIGKFCLAAAYHYPETFFYGV